MKREIDWKSLAVACALSARVCEKVVHVSRPDRAIITTRVWRCSSCGRYVAAERTDVPVKSHIRHCIVGRIERLSKAEKKASAT